MLGRPVAGPPNIPPERLAALRSAFMATMKDADFLAEAKRVGLDIDPASADEVEKLLARFATFAPTDISRWTDDGQSRFVRSVRLCLWFLITRIPDTNARTLFLKLVCAV